MDFELIELSGIESTASSCFPDFFDDCNPTDDACFPSGMDDEEL